MRNLTELNRLRMRKAEQIMYGVNGDAGNGVFRLGKLRVIASDGDGWDHVSVSHRNRCPTWDEMERVKRLFFRDHETVMQLHVPPVEHVNEHPYCLHLWRPQAVEIPRPPAAMVGSEAAS